MSPISSEEPNLQLLQELSAYQNCLDLGISVPPDQSVFGQTIPAELESSLKGMRRCLDLLDETRREQSARNHSLSEAPERNRSDLPYQKQIAHFQVQEALGLGGFGIVYRAYDSITRRDVAIKVPRMEVLATQELNSRFQHEAVAAAKLDHPNVIQIYECGVHGLIPYIAMPYVAGGNLATWMVTQKQVSPVLAAELVKQLAEGVAHAHLNGIYHRDIKPTNVLLVPLNDAKFSSSLPFTPKLTDFGLAKCSDIDSLQTRSGTILGTASYMAPELAHGKTTSAAPEIDVYGLGAILYELLTGIPPFRAETDLLTMQQVLHEDAIPVRKLSPQVPEDLSIICLKCLEKLPEHRYRSAQQLAKDLGRYLAGDPIHARPASKLRRLRRWCHRNPGRAVFGTMSLAGVIVLGLLVFWHNSSLARQLQQTEFQRDRAESQALEIRRRACLADTRLAQVALAHGDFDQATTLLKAYLPRDGEKDVRHFAWWFMWRQVAEKTRVIAKHQGRATSVAMTSTGDLAASGGDDGLIQVRELPSGTLRFILRENEKGPIQKLIFSPDNQRLASAGKDGSVRVWNVKTGQQNFVQINRADQLSEIAYSADGKVLASAGQRPEISLWDAETGEARGVLEGHQSNKAITGLAFHPSQSFLISSSQDGTIRFWNLKTMKPDERLPRGMIRMQKPGDWCRCIAISPDGKSLLAGTNQLELLQWSLDDSSRGRMISKSQEPSEICCLYWLRSGEPILGYSRSGIRLADQRNFSWSQSQVSYDRRKVHSLAGSDQCDQLLSAGATGEVRLWELPLFRNVLRKEEMSLERPDERLSPHTFFCTKSGFGLHLTSRKFENGHMINATKEQSRVCMLDSIESGVRARVSQPTEETGFALSSSGKYLAGFSVRGYAYCKETSNFQSIWQVGESSFTEDMAGRKMFAEISPDDSFLVTAVLKQAVQFSMHNGKVANRWSFKSEIVSLVIRSQARTGSIAYFACRDGIVHVIDLKTGAELRSIRVEDNEICSSIGVSVGGTMMGVGDEKGHVVILRLDNLSQVQRFPHQGRVLQVEFFDRDQYLVTRDDKFHFWSIADGSELLTIPLSEGVFNEENEERLIWDRHHGSFTVSPDGGTVAIPRRDEILFIESPCVKNRAF